MDSGLDAPSLYDIDYPTWSERQAAVLWRPRARPDRPYDLDFKGVVDEATIAVRSRLAGRRAFP
jgi:hypothetical protein